MQCRSPVSLTYVTLFYLTNIGNLFEIGESLRSQGFLKGGPKSTYQRNGSPTCHLTLSPLKEPEVARSLPFTLITSQAIPIPSFSFSDGPTTSAVEIQMSFALAAPLS